MRDISFLINAYTNEKSTYKLLPYFKNLSEFLSFIKNKMYEIENDHILKSLLELEYNRIEFFVKEYLLCRLEKMRSLYKIDEDYLNPNELEFYRNHKKLLEKNKIDYGIIDDRIEYVGFIVINNINEIKLDNEISNLKSGEFYITEIKQIYSELISGNVKLV